MSVTTLLLVALIFLAIATIYSSVGFGGGSSYLAILTFVVVSFYTIRSMALVCNIIVVGGSLYWFAKKGHFDLRQFLPFVLTSVPMAFLGASFRLDEYIFFIILGFALIASALFLFWQATTSQQTSGPEDSKEYPNYLSYILGACIGFLSGLVGIGGGIFLAPLLHHLQWGRPVKIASLACFFILVNSVSGIGGLLYAGTLELPVKEILVLGIVVLLGGQLGIRLSLKKLSAQGLRFITALLVLIVGMRVLLVNGLQWF